MTVSSTAVKSKFDVDFGRLLGQPELAGRILELLRSGQAIKD